MWNRLKFPGIGRRTVPTLAESVALRSRCKALAYDRKCNTVRKMLEDAFATAPNEIEARRLLLDILSSHQTSEQNYDTSAWLRNYATKQRGAGG